MTERHGFNFQLFDEGNIKKEKSASLKRGIRTLTKRIEEHRTYIADPTSHCLYWNVLSEERKRGYIDHWKKEIDNFMNSIFDRVKELEERGEFNE